MLKCATSLWSADLANLAAEIRRVEPYSDRFHIDVTDGRYVDLLLFFPDLVRAIRPVTRRPFEVHLIAWDPLHWVQPFVDAGADAIIFYWDATDNPATVMDAIRAAGKQVGISLRVEDPLDVLEPLWDNLDIVTMMGTYMGVKGVQEIDPSVTGKVAAARRLIDERGLKTVVEVDGGIRRHTVPQLHAAGADYIVPGSLMFAGDPAEVHDWLRTL